MNIENWMTIDYHVLSIINSWTGRYAGLDWFMITVAQYGPLAFDFYLILLWFSGNSEEKLQANRKRAIYAATSALLALGLNQVISYTWFRQRPYVAHPIHLLLPSSPDPSFPSDHAAGGFSISAGVLFGRPLPGLLLMVIAALLAFSRVYVGIHYPTDVLGGALIGILSALIVEAGKGLLELPVRWVLLLWQRIENMIPVLKRMRR